MRGRALVAAMVLGWGCCAAQQAPLTVSGWRMQDAARLSAAGLAVSALQFDAASWYKATVPGTVLATLVDNGVYPDPLYGENMRSIPESLNKASYWYRTEVEIPRSYRGRRVWLHFGGVNYAAEIWWNGTKIGAIRGAFLRGDFDVTGMVTPGRRAALAVLVSPQPHPGTPHEHTLADGTGPNGGETAIDGPTFLSTIGWDWVPAIRDRDTGLWQPVTISSAGPVTVKDPFVTSQLSPAHDAADLKVSASVQNATARPVSGRLAGTISGFGVTIAFGREVSLAAGERLEVKLDRSTTPELHLLNPKLWWPNGYGDPNLYRLELRFEEGKEVSDAVSANFGVRSVAYQAPGSDNLTLVVNGVKMMVRGGNWGMDDAMKRIPRERLEAQFHLHALAHLNMIRNWVGQSTSPEFYELADKYGILLWDEFFQPNPNDGPNVTDIDTYMANVRDKVLRYRIHPSIVVWCARNEGHPPRELDDLLSRTMAELDPGRLYQSSSADGRGVSSHGPYYWRSPRFFYQINEAFKTETGSVSVPTIESIQGMMPRKDWETIDDDWAQHDMAAGAQRGDEYPMDLAKEYGPIRNLADFVRKAQLANYVAFRAMYESRNSGMFERTTGVLTWMSHPAQPSFVWQLYHYDLEPNSSLYAVQKAAEMVHVQMNEADRSIEVINNLPADLRGLTITQTTYQLDGRLDRRTTAAVDLAPASSAKRVYVIAVNPHISKVYFVKLDLTDATGKLLSTNFYWQNVAQDDFEDLANLPVATLEIEARPRVEGEKTIFEVTVANPGSHVALMAHLQLHRGAGGKRVLPVFYSDNYLSLAPGETRSLTIEAASQEVAGGAELLVDGYNIAVKRTYGEVPVMLNQNAQPLEWPASGIVAPALGGGR